VIVHQDYRYTGRSSPHRSSEWSSPDRKPPIKVIGPRTVSPRTKENRQGHTTLPAQDKSHNLIADLRKTKERLKYPASQYLEPFQFVKISHFNNFKFLERLHKAQVFKFHISIISSSSSTPSKFAIFSIIESMLN
jgi:hypothetical protein